MISKETLIQIGLSEAETAVYESLLSLGQAQVQAIIKKAGLKKPTVYHILNQFVKRGLAEEVSGTAKKQFRPTSPENLEVMVLAEVANAERAKKVLEYALPSLTSQYALALGRPHVASYEGPAGIKRLYDDIIHVKKDILLIRSPHDDEYPELEKMIEAQIGRQVKACIHVRAVTPLVPETIETATKYDGARLITRRIIPRDEFMTPAQIIIYGEKVALTSFQKPILTTIIENKDIRDTFVTIFEYIWSAATPKHQEILKGVKEQ